MDFPKLKVMAVALLIASGMAQASEVQQGGQKDEFIKFKKHGDYTVVLPGGYIALPPPDLTKGKEKRRVEYERFPLTPEEIKEIRKKRLEQARAKSAPLINPDIKSRSIQFSFETGAELPVIHVAPGFVSSITFVDASGNPWSLGDGPVVGDGNGFLINVPKNAPNIVNVSTTKPAGQTTLSVVLKGQPVPVVIRLKVSDKVHDARVDMMAQATSPDAAPEQPGGTHGSAIPDVAVSGDLLAFVSGVAPKEAREVKVDAPYFRAWVMNDALYVRGIRRLVSPSWEAEAHGAGDINVYRLPLTPWVLYADTDGRIKTAQIEIEEAN